MNSGRWIPTFKVGKQLDSSGWAHEWTAAELDEIVASYDLDVHEAPVVIGHPATDGPAYGWVEKLRRVGDVLWVRVRETVPQFREWVRQGLYKRISLALYQPDESPVAGKWYLRHVGFLGATPPAVKGLPAVVLSEKKSVVFETDKEHVPLEKALDQEEALDKFMRAFDIFRSRVINSMLDEETKGKKAEIGKHLKELSSVVDGLEFKEPAEKVASTVEVKPVAEVAVVGGKARAVVAPAPTPQQRPDWWREEGGRA